MAADKGLSVGIVGATGAVGKEIINVLFSRKFPLKRLHLWASARSAGQSVETPSGAIIVEEFKVDEARKVDIVFLAVSGSFAKMYAPLISRDGGAVVIDNSSAFRYDDGVPLVVPEINGETAAGSFLIANPNCTTAIAAMALWPLHQAFMLKRVIVSTYQAASGAGIQGMDELRAGAGHALQGKSVDAKIFQHPLAFNVIPHIDEFQSNGYTKEEMKVVWETQKIFQDDSISVSCTAVRVPTLRAHAESITVECAKPISPEEARAVLEKAPGVCIVDDPSGKKYPMPLNASEKDDVEVGRIRQSLIFGEYGLDLFVCGDQLLRGAALNAVIIAEYLQANALLAR